MDCTKHITARKVLFHGGEPWPGAWQTRTSKSTTIPLEAGSNRSTNGTSHGRAGLTYSSIELHPYAETTEFHGWLDRASPHPTNKSDTTASASVNNIWNYAYMESSRDNDANTDPQTWDLSGYDAIELVLGKSDGKIYTLALEDDRSFLSWEVQFRCVNEKGLMTATRKILQFKDLMPQRRRTSTIMSACPRALDLRKVRRFGIGICSYGSLQAGPFSLSMYSINAVKLDFSCPCAPVRDLVPGRDEELKVERSRLRSRVAEVASYLGMRMPKQKTKPMLKQK